MEITPRLMIDLPLNCNDRCVFCSYWENSKETFPSWDKYKEQIEMYYQKGGVNTIMLSGGEPLYNINAFKQFLKNVGEYNQEVTLCTNGKLLNLLDADDFKVISRIGVSLLSHKKESFNELKQGDTYDLVIKNITDTSKNPNKPNVDLLTIINAITVNHLVDFFNFAIDLGLNAGIDIQDSNFAKARITPEIEHLFNFSLTTLEKQLFLIQSMSETFYSDDYIASILDYYSSLQANEYRSISLSESLCSPKCVRISKQGELNCICNQLSRGIREFGEYSESVRECKRYCGVKSCVTRLLKFDSDYQNIFNPEF
jgi:MoaA/NifB/PqqE/SkfB family radical SAM enzyme